MTETTTALPAALAEFVDAQLALNAAEGPELELETKRVRLARKAVAAAVNLEEDGAEHTRLSCLALDIMERVPTREVR
jgi:hypothetical protein